MSKKFYKTEEFKSLASDWNKKLKDSGFEDIEKQDIKQTMITPQKFTTYKTQYYGGMDYYQFCSAVLREFEFKKQIHREIFELHAEGKSVRDIEKLFQSRKGKLSHMGIHKIIERIKNTFIYGKKQ